MQKSIPTRRVLTMALAGALALVPATARADMLTGGLLGSLLRGDSFTGPRLVDILILGLAVFVLLRLVAGRTKSPPPDTPPRPEPDQPRDEPAGATPPPSQNKPDMYTMAQATWDALKSPSARPANGPTIDAAPADASPDDQFLAGAKMAYGRIVTAMAERDLDDLTQFVSPSFLAQLKNQLPATPAGRPDILLVDASLADSREENGRTTMVVDYKTLVREPGASQNTERLERWRFSRDNTVAGSNWLLEGMERR
jgi:predicted lipid-binding transport protein (Tim44 family)